MFCSVLFHKVKLYWKVKGDIFIWYLKSLGRRERSKHLTVQNNLKPRKYAIFYSNVNINLIYHKEATIRMCLNIYCVLFENIWPSNIVTYLASGNNICLLYRMKISQIRHFYLEFWHRSLFWKIHFKALLQCL